MKLLLDQNLSFKLVGVLRSRFGECNHLRDFHLIESNDLEIRQFALEHNFVIVTRDSDFFELALLHGIPPKVLWIRSGNSSSTHIENLLLDNFNAILEFESNNQICLQLY